MTSYQKMATGGSQLEQRYPWVDTKGVDGDSNGVRRECWLVKIDFVEFVGSAELINGDCFQVKSFFQV